MRRSDQCPHVFAHLLIATKLANTMQQQPVKINLHFFKLIFHVSSFRRSLVGGIEILLLYLCPGMTIGDRNALTDTGFLGMLSNNMRLYATFVLIVQFTIVAMGVCFVKLLAPVSLVCVILSVFVEKTISGIGQQYLLRKLYLYVKSLYSVYA
ncbi:hypothetical protein niasHT_027710 [Heterodera trifolii]|uniref:Uncharacterized protein n=1 Tax=Heterodera trifolii TaxID=157864 RepID=A0ABD2KBI6_9BILA